MGTRSSQEVSWGDTAETGIKYCNKCSRMLPATNFFLATRSGSGLHWRCRDCERQYLDSRREPRREQQRKYYMEVKRWKNIAKAPLKRPPYKSKCNPLGIDLRKRPHEATY